MTSTSTSRSRAVLPALAFDIGFIAAELLLELGLFRLHAGGVAALIVLVGHFGFYLALGYSVTFDIGEAKHGLLEQLGITNKGFFFQFVVGMGSLFAFFMNFAVALAMPIMCLHGMLISVVGPKGIDALSPTSPLKFLAVAAGFLSILLSMRYDDLFRKRVSPGLEDHLFSWVVPVLCVTVGASLGPLEQHITAASHAGATGEGLNMTFLFYYLPLRYMVARLSGVTWPGLALSLAVVAGCALWL